MSFNNNSMSFNKNLDTLKVGLAISTYTEDNTDDLRYSIIDKSLKSLQEQIKKTKVNIYVVIVIDGKIPQRHIDILNKYDFNTYRRPENGGVAKTKNTSIRLLLEQNVDIGYLADDDLLYKDNCFEKYSECILKGQIHHMSFTQMNPIVHPKNEWTKFGYIECYLNEQKVMKHSGHGVGCFMSFTPELINTIGYFKVMPGKYGYEHINFTERAKYSQLIPYVSDLINSLDYLDHIGFEAVGYNKFKKNHSISEEYRKSENNKNKGLFMKELNKYTIIIE